jgi:hypothetical protein
VHQLAPWIAANKAVFQTEYTAGNRATLGATVWSTTSASSSKEDGWHVTCHSAQEWEIPT